MVCGHEVKPFMKYKTRLYVCDSLASRIFSYRRRDEIYFIYVLDTIYFLKFFVVFSPRSHKALARTGYI